MRKKSQVQSRLLGKLLLDEESTALLGGLIECVEGVNGGVPVDASIGDGDTVLEAGWALGGNVLATRVDVGLDHDTGNRGLASSKLSADIGADLGLVVVVLLGVAVCRRVEAYR